MRIHRFADTMNRSVPILIALLAILVSCTNPVSGDVALSGHIRVDGSTALYPLVRQAASEFQKLYPQVTIDVAGGGSLTGLNDFTSSKSAIGDSDVYADPATYPDPRITDHIICVIPFLMVVNPDVHITSLTAYQIAEIFSTHALHNWSELGGPDLPIVPVVRPDSSGTRATFIEYVLNGRDEQDNGSIHRKDSSQDIHDAVASIPGAISYLAAPYLDKSVRAIAIDNHLPTKDTIEAGTYTFWNYEHMYTMGDSNPIVKQFLAFMITNHIQNEAQSMGYISMQNMKLPRLVE